MVEVRGFGQTMSHLQIPDSRIGYFHPRDAMDADLTYASFFLGRPLLGMRVWDALSAVAYVRSRPVVDPGHTAIVGRGWAGVLAAYAGALDRGLACVAVESVPASYEEITRSEEYTQPVSLMLPGVLKDFDLPDVHGAVAPRPSSVAWEVASPDL